MKKKSYDLIISLGAICGTSTWMRMLGLQLASYPFDWLTGVGFKTNADLVLNHFKDFMRQKDFVLQNQIDKDINDNYINTNTGIHHMHDFRAGSH